MTKAANISIGSITGGPNHHGHSLGAESVCAYQLVATYADEPDNRTDPDMSAFVRLSELRAKGGAEPDGHGQNLRFVLSVRSAHAPDTRGLGKEREEARDHGGALIAKVLRKGWPVRGARSRVLSPHGEKLKSKTRFPLWRFDRDS